MMIKLLPVIFCLCLFNLNVTVSEQISNIATLEDETIKANFGDYPLVSEDKRDSTICPVSSRVFPCFLSPLCVYLIFAFQNATEVEEIRLIDGKQYSKLTILDVTHQDAFHDTKSGLTYIKKLRLIDI